MSLSPATAQRPARTYDVFISYRRLEASYLAGWLHYYFASRLGEDRVFLDIDAIRAGFEFMTVIHAAIAEAKVMFVLIGPYWATHPDGTPRLADPSDPVRIEVEAAFARDLRVIPLLLDGASLPARALLPPSMARLLDLNAVSISPVVFRERLNDLLRDIADVLPSATELEPPDGVPAHFSPIARAAVDRRDAEQRSRLLTKLSQLYGDYMRQALHDDRNLQMPLRLRPQPHVVRRPADVLLPFGQRVDGRAEVDGRLLPLLDESGGMDGDGLLVLGGPGAGKSTALVELAVEMVEHARKDPHRPVPVYLPLKHWGTGCLPISRWVVQELAELYEVPRSFAERWTSGRELLFLFDGLDELPSRELRAACIASINSFQRFGREYQVPLVVTARRYEYETLPEPLDLDNAVEILPLRPAAVEQRLADVGPAMGGVLAALEKDPGLRPMLAVPLFLSLIARTYADELTALDVVGHGRADRLFSKYVAERFALERRTQSGRPNVYPPDKTIRWLSSLAALMSGQQQAVFVLGRLPVSWLPNRLLRGVVSIVPGLLVGVSCLAPWGAFPDVYAGLRGLLIVSLAAVATVPVLEALRSPTPSAWSWSLSVAWSRASTSLLTTVTTCIAFAIVDGAAAVNGATGSSRIAFDMTSLFERLPGIGLGVVVLSGVVAVPRSTRTMRAGRRRAFEWAVCVGITLALFAGTARTITGGPGSGALLAGSWLLETGTGAWLVGTSGPADRVSWSWRPAMRPRTPALLAVAAGGIAFVGYGLASGARAGLANAVALAVCTAATTALLAGLERAGIPVYRTPNEATWRSFRSGMLVGTAATVVLGSVAGGLVLLLVSDPNIVAAALDVGTAVGFQLGLIIATAYGLGSAAQHWLLRVLYWQTGVAPLRYGRWLDHTVSLKLLYRSGGGGYLFVHGLLQEHLARGHGSATRGGAPERHE